jgi:hypothetical protein
VLRYDEVRSHRKCETRITVDIFALSDYQNTRQRRMS